MPAVPTDSVPASLIQIRRVLTQVEDIHHEFGPAPAAPHRRGAIAAVLTNPYAGGYVADILPMMKALEPVGLELARTLLAALAVPAERVEGYGKGAIVGAGGELEHGALWHVPGGYAMRELLGWQAQDAAAATAYAAGRPAPSTSASAGGAATSDSAASTASPAQPGNALAIVPSTKKVGPPGATLDVPITHLNAAYVRSHFDAIEVRVPGAPRADELVVVLAMTIGPRVHARVGGLAADAIARWDGLR